MAELCIWAERDRCVLDPYERMRGYFSAVCEDGHPWNPTETGKNHRIVKVPGVPRTSLLYLRARQISRVETSPGKIKRSPIARFKHRLSAEHTEQVCNLPEHEVLVLSQRILEDRLRSAPDGPDRMMTNQERAVYYDGMKLRRRERLAARIRHLMSTTSLVH